MARLQISPSSSRRGLTDLRRSCVATDYPSCYVNMSQDSPSLVLDNFQGLRQAPGQLQRQMLPPNIVLPQLLRQPRLHRLQAWWSVAIAAAPKRRAAAVPMTDARVVRLHRSARANRWTSHTARYRHDGVYRQQCEENGYPEWLRFSNGRWIWEGGAGSYYYQ